MTISEKSRDSRYISDEGYLCSFCLKVDISCFGTLKTDPKHSFVYLSIDI